MGWIPALNLLEPATEHPARRNALMIAVHLVWGTATAEALRELAAARETIFAGEDQDVLVAGARNSPPSPSARCRAGPTPRNRRGPRRPG